MQVCATALETLPLPEPPSTLPLTEPHFSLDVCTLGSALRSLRQALPGADIHYALKANSAPLVLTTLADLGCGFEAASWGEIALLLSLGVAPERIIYGTAVKPRAHVERAFMSGISRFAADAVEELDMLAAAAPGASVLIRIKLADTDSVFNLNQKFGALPANAARLVRRARALGLVAWGLSFNVGSQALRSTAWGDGIAVVAPILAELRTEGIRLDTLNIGGGFPVPYAHAAVPSLGDITAHLSGALRLLPYTVNLVAEPGRALVAASTSLVASVVRRIERADGPWLYLDCGVYNALFEALRCQGGTRYPVVRLGAHAATALASFTLAGPTGDGLDIIATGVPLPRDTGDGDTLRFANVGAYTSALASTFNGFPLPALVVQDG